MRTSPAIAVASCLAGALLLGPAAVAVPAQPGGPAGDAGPSVPVACTVAQLPLPAGYVTGAVAGGDPTGRHLVGWVTTDFGQEDAAVWRPDGTVDVLDLPVSSSRPLLDATKDGTVVGSGHLASGRHIGFVVSPDGEVTELGNGGAPGSHAVAIDADGTVVGWVGGADTSTPAIWRPDDRASPRLLDGSPTGQTQGVGIAKGRVVATAYGIPTRAWVWPRPRSAPKALVGTHDPSHVNPSNAEGRYATGSEYHAATERYRVLRWDLTTREVTAYDVPMSAGSINKHGVIGGGDATRALLLVDGQLEVLPHLAGGTASRVHLVTAKGDAAGYTSISGSLRPVRWTC